MANYSNTRALTISGDLTLNSSGNNFSFVEPAAQLVLIVIRTKRGTCGADPTLGVDWDLVERSPDGMRKGARRAIEQALAPWVSRGRIANVKVQTEEQPLGRLAIDVSFEDPRRPGRRNVKAVMP